MRLFVFVALAVGAPTAGAAQQCPPTVELVMPALRAADRNVAQQFANCMSNPMMPSAQGRIGNLAACRASLPLRRSDNLEQAVRSVEQTAIRLGSCTSRIMITTKSKSKPTK